MGSTVVGATRGLSQVVLKHEATKATKTHEELE